MDKGNFISGEEMASIAGLIEALDQFTTQIGVEATLTDANGEGLGVVAYNPDNGSYAYYPNGRD